MRGVACLLHCRNKLVSDDTAVMQPYQIVVTLQRTRANRTDAAPSHAAHESVRCLLLGASSPFQVILQPTSTVLTATSNALYTWIQSSTFTELTFLLQVGTGVRRHCDAGTHAQLYTHTHMPSEGTGAACVAAFLWLQRERALTS